MRERLLKPFARLFGKRQPAPPTNPPASAPPPASEASPTSAPSAPPTPSAMPPAIEPPPAPEIAAPATPSTPAASPAIAGLTARMTSPVAAHLARILSAGSEESNEDDEDEESDAAPSKLADRAYFGEDVWGAASRQRGAKSDTARLARYDLPILHTERELADWLGIPLGRLRWYTHDRPADTTWHYVRYAVPKRGGQGERIILAPKRELKALQRRVLDSLVARVPIAATTHGFVAGRSILTNAQQHVARPILLKLDLKDFFPSVTYPRVRGLFIALGYSYAVASALALLCTEYDRQPFDRDGERYYISIGPRHLVQGAPTSPALANLVAWRLDRRLSGLAAKRGFTYTRYADDLTFSGADAEAANRLRGTAQRIIAAERFTVNAAKTRLTRQGGRQMVTGLVVNAAPATPRALRRELRAILHNAQRDGLEAQNRDQRPDYAAYLRGMIAFVGSANPRHAAPLKAALRQVDKP